MLTVQSGLWHRLWLLAPNTSTACRLDGASCSTSSSSSRPLSRRKPACELACSRIHWGQAQPSLNISYNKFTYLINNPIWDDCDFPKCIVSYHHILFGFTGASGGTIKSEWGCVGSGSGYPSGSSSASTHSESHGSWSAQNVLNKLRAGCYLCPPHLSSIF